MANKTGITREGSGRTKGSFSFVLISLAQLNGKFNDTTTPIKVGRKWAQECGFANLVSGAAGELTAQVQGKTPETKVEATEVEL